MAFASADPWAHALHQLYPPEPDREVADAIEFAVRRSRGRYQRYRHVEIINAAVDETIATGGRLIVEASVRHSKSETISKWKAAHYIGTHPDNRVILAGHEADFAKRWGRAARDILEEHGPEVFGVRVSPRSGAANRWDIEGHDGGMLTVGVGGSPIGRGADLCIAAGTRVATPQGMVEIESLANRGGILWAYDHARRAVVERRIVAATESISSDLVEVEFSSGRVLRCTPDHPIYVQGTGYVEAGQLAPGAGVSALGGADLPAVRRDVRADRQGTATDRQAGQGGLLLQAVRRHASGQSATGHASQAPREGAREVRSVREAVHPAGLGPRQEGPPRDGEVLLLPDVRGTRLLDPEGRPALRALRRPHREPATALLPAVPPDPATGTAEARRQSVPVLRGGLHPQVIEDHLLLTGVCELGTLRPDGGPGELPLQGRDVLRPLVQAHAPPHHREGRRLRRVWQHGEAIHSPHQRGPQEQHAGEPGDHVRHPPHRAPQVEPDAVAMVRRLRPGRYPVYDLQVEGAHNFFAGEVLVHNCLIDDPVKSFEAAMSPLVRQRIIEWYTGTMASRIEPGGAVVIIMARWHSDDLAGYLQREDPDTWRVLRLPAICDDPAADAMGRQAGEPLWPERWPLEALAERKRDVTMALGEAVWLAQYQQRPAAIGGGTFPEGRWGFIAPHDVPDGLRWVRAWDLAATEGAGDWTVGARMARLPDGRFVIDDVRRGQWDARDARARIKAAADMDPPGTTHELPQDPGQAGKDQAQQLVSLLAGHIVHARPQSGSKEVRAAGYAAQQQAGNVVLVEGQWNGAWVSEHAAFPRGSHDDQVDTGATAFNALAGVPDRPAKGRSPAGRRTARGPALARTGGRVTQ